MFARPLWPIPVAALTWLLTACAAADPGAGRPIEPIAGTTTEGAVAAGSGAALAPFVEPADGAASTWQDDDSSVGIITGQRPAYRAFPYVDGYFERFRYPLAGRYWFSPFARWPWNSGWGWPAYGYEDPYWRARWYDAERHDRDDVVCNAKQKACYAKDDGDYRPAYQATRDRYGRAAERELRRRYRDDDGPDHKRRQQPRDQAADGSVAPARGTPALQPAPLPPRATPRTVQPAAAPRLETAEPRRRHESRTPQGVERSGTISKAKPMPVPQAERQRPAPLLRTPPPVVQSPSQGLNNRRGVAGAPPLWDQQPAAERPRRGSRGDGGRAERLR